MKELDNIIINPETGDNIHIYMIIFGIAIIGLIVTFIYKIKKNKKNTKDKK